MVNAAERDSAAAAKELSDLLTYSSITAFPGLGDPLRLNFGAHRWLSGAREESYSDWLAWIIDQQDRPAEVFSLLGINVSEPTWSRCLVQREVCIPGGRLDILIRCESQATAVIEIKTASEIGSVQLGCYLDWLERQPGPLGVVLIAIDEPRDGDLGEYTFCSWKRISARLRTWAREWLRAGRGLEAALTLAFCGAVEHNLLGFGSHGLNAPRTAQYLGRWLEEYQNAR